MGQVPLKGVVHGERRACVTEGKDRSGNLVLATFAPAGDSRPVERHPGLLVAAHPSRPFVRGNPEC